MGIILSYSLASAIILALLYPVFHQIVNRSTFFRFNRFALLGGLLLAFALPPALETGIASGSDDYTFVDLPVPEIVVNEPIDNSHVAEVSALTDSNNQWTSVAVILYSMGVLFFILRELISYNRLFRLILRSDKTRSGRFVICRLNDAELAPFSWGNYIFLHDSASTTGAEDCMFLHEKAHTAKLHWLDILLVDIVGIIMWYNPLVWLTRRLIKLNHEFEADSEVIGSGVDTYDYQRLLVIKAMGGRAIPVTNSFAANKRSFRKRVLVMSKKRSSKNIRLISLCAIPSVVFAIIAISLPISAGILENISNYRFERDEISEKTEHILPEISEQTESESNKAAIDEVEEIKELPSPLTNQAALAEIIRLTLENVITDIDTKVNIEIVVGEDGRVKEVLTNASEGALLAEAIDRKLSGVRFEQTTENGRPVEVRFNVPVTIHKNRKDNTHSSKAQKAEETIFPEFIGGNSALNTFIIENIKTPNLLSDTQSKNRQTVNVHFTVDIDGSIKDTKIADSQGRELDEEAIRVINLTSGMWKPAVQDGAPAPYSLSIPITFSSL